jgi:hypothetical protein
MLHFFLSPQFLPSLATPFLYLSYVFRLILCYAWSLVYSKCLNDLVAGTVQIGIAGCHFWNPILVTDVNARCYHPLMEGYEFTSFCYVVRVCMCLAMSMILDRIGGTSLATPRVWFSVYTNCCTLAVEP